jgi:arginase
LLIGVAAALREAVGRVGLAFVDGHLDLYDGATSPTGEAADTELAVLLGRGPRELTGLAGTPPLIKAHDVLAFGHRDPDEDRLYAEAAAAEGVVAFDPEAIRRHGPSLLGARAAARFETEPGRFWLHLDFDVLDQDVLPAVDYRMPGGLDWDELTSLVRPLALSSGLIGADITIYNPSYDPEGHYAWRIVDFLASTFRAEPHA